MPARHPPTFPHRGWPLSSGCARKGHHEGLLHGDAARGAPCAPRPSQGTATSYLHAGVLTGLHLRWARPQQDQGMSPAAACSPCPPACGQRMGHGEGAAPVLTGEHGVPHSIPLAGGWGALGCVPVPSGCEAGVPSVLQEGQGAGQSMCQDTWVLLPVLPCSDLGQVPMPHPTRFKIGGPGHASPLTVSPD